MAKKILKGPFIFLFLFWVNFEKKNRQKNPQNLGTSIYLLIQQISTRTEESDPTQSVA